MGAKRMTKHRIAAACMAVLLAGATPAVIAPVQASAAAMAAALTDREKVRWIAGKYPMTEVRTAAWLALTSSDPDTAVARFLATGYDAAIKRAQETRARNLDFARRIYAVYTAEYSPEVNAGARWAMNGTDADRDLFARIGFAAALERDRAAREQSGENARAIVEQDRAFVRLLATSDPGPQVRAAAEWALRPGSGDGDLVEFFVHGWAGASRQDLETQRIRCADADVAWQRRLAGLVVAAKEAEQAANEAAEEFREQARAEAARAWHSAADQAGSGTAIWDEAHQVAVEQAANWARIAEAAAAAGGPNWDPIGAAATGNQADWTEDLDWAARQVAYWNSLLADALAGEQRMS